MDIEKLKFPIGKCESNKKPDLNSIDAWIKDIEEFPAKLENLTKDLSIEQLNWKYRPGGWSIKQVIHHCADSHMNSLIRFKLALTEEKPSIRPYEESLWAELSDSLDDDLSGSMLLLKGLHKKWGLLLRNLNQAQLKLEFIHPEHGEKFSLAENIGIYSWHCNHHLAHIKNGIISEGQYN